MKAISLWQPWASALFTDLKPDETRHWPMPLKLVGEPIAIQASLRDTRDERIFWSDFVERDPVMMDHFRLMGIHSYQDLPRGCIIGWVVFKAPLHTSAMPATAATATARIWGDYSPKRFYWPKQKAALFDKYYPCTGRQGFFDWTRPDEA